MNEDTLKFESLYNEVLNLLENKLPTLTSEELIEAKNWIIDSGFTDPDTNQVITMDALNSETPEVITNFIERHYEGGVDSFKINSQLVKVKSVETKNENVETLEEAGRCTGPTKKASSDRKGKKWMQCVKSGGGYKRIHWGQADVRVTGKSGNTKRKKSFRARHKCSTAKPGTAKYQACKDW